MHLQHDMVVCAETYGRQVLGIRPDDRCYSAAKLFFAYGLGNAVYGKKHGYDAARRLRSGMASVNSVLSFAGFPSLPFGGVGESGFGRIHGEDGLKEFTRAKAIARKKYSVPMEMMAFDRPAWLPSLVERLDNLRFGRRGR